MGAAVKVTRMDHTAQELHALATKSKNTTQARRLLALATVLEGASRHDAARHTDMDRQTLRDWVHRYNEAAIDGLISRVAPGTEPKLAG
jgi:transposase